MFQKALLQRIKKNLGNEESLNEAIATALQISYDAAHRRVSLKSKFSLEESVRLAKYYNISLDSLFEVVEENYVVVQKTKQLTNEDDLQLYFETSYEALLPLLNKKDAEIYYSAKDLPLFYTLNDDALSYFKMYVWLKLFDENFRKVQFDHYVPKVSTIQSARKLGELYSNLKVSEIWNITTVNSTLKQIHFYHKANQVSTKIALQLCNELKELLSKVFENIIANNQKFKFYYNELLVMNNQVFVTTPQKQSLFVPRGMLSYFSTSDTNTCKEAEIYFNNQLYHSKLLNTAGEKEQHQFYYKVIQKIDALIDLIKATELLGFE